MAGYLAQGPLFKLCGWGNISTVEVECDQNHDNSVPKVRAKCKKFIILHVCYQPTLTKGLTVRSGIYGLHRLHAGDGSAVMSWNTTPLKSNAEYCNGNDCKLQCHTIKVWANIEEV